MIAIKPVAPGSPGWPAFLALYAEYLQRYWPEAYAKVSPPDVVRTLHTELLTRCRQGGRGLFLLCRDEHACGLANVWLDRDAALSTMHVAECYVRPAVQRQGLGRMLWHEALCWGRRHGAKRIYLETDADNPAANAFWQVLGLQRIDRGAKRLGYFGGMPAVDALPSNPAHPD